jgi:hypothetical protein
MVNHGRWRHRGRAASTASLVLDKSVGFEGVLKFGLIPSCSQTDLK